MAFFGLLLIGLGVLGIFQILEAPGNTIECAIWWILFMVGIPIGAHLVIG